MFPILSLEKAAEWFTDARQPLTLEFCEYLRTMMVNKTLPEVLKRMCRTTTKHRSLTELQKVHFLQRILELSGKSTKEEAKSIKPEKSSQPLIENLMKEIECRKRLKSALADMKDNPELDKRGKLLICLFSPSLKSVCFCE